MSLRVICAAAEDYEACAEQAFRCPPDEYEPAVPREDFNTGGYLFLSRPSDGLSLELSGPSLVFRTSPARNDGFFDGEPRRAWVTQLLERADAATQETGEIEDYEASERAFARSVRSLCDDESLVPEGVRRGASIEVLGARGWRRARVGRCELLQSGHNGYLAVRVSGAPRGALLARIPMGEPPVATDAFMRAPRLPRAEADALAHAREELTRLGRSKHALAEPQHTGLIEIPTAMSLLHIGVTYGVEEGVGREPRDTCRRVGDCDTALVLYDPNGADSEVLLWGDGEEDGGVWSILGTVALGEARGVVLRYDNLGWEEVALLTVDPDGGVRGQGLYYMMGG